MCYNCDNTQKIVVIIVIYVYYYTYIIWHNFVLMDRNKLIKDNIYKIRRDKGLSQECIASNLNISINSYRKLERGGTALINKRLDKLAHILGVKIEDILLCSDSNDERFLELPFIKEKEDRIRELEDHIKKLNQCIDLLNDKIGYYSKSK